MSLKGYSGMSEVETFVTEIPFLEVSRWLPCTQHSGSYQVCPTELYIEEGHPTLPGRHGSTDCTVPGAACLAWQVPFCLHNQRSAFQ